MTHIVLPSDIELATSLRSTGHSDEEVTAILLRRGIAPEAAAQLMDDLRNGRNVKTQIPSSLEIAPRRRSRSRSSEAQKSEARAEPTAPQSPSPAERPARRHSNKPKFRFWPWVIVIWGWCCST